MMNAERFDAAKRHLSGGFSIIPIGNDKKPPRGIRWKRYQSEHASESTLRKWISRDDVTGLAVVCGKVSGNLVMRDFDSVQAYEGWAKAHPELAAILPTVETARGRHVYFASSYLKSHTCADGEYRAEGNYAILPPSIHPSGVIYTWLIPLPDGDLPFIDDPESAGLLHRDTEQTEPTEQTEQIEPTEPMEQIEMTEQTEAIDFHLIKDDVENAIVKTLPTKPGERNRCVFKFARALKAIPALANADASVLIPILRKWHRRALSVIRTKAFEETELDFYFAWQNAIFPLCENMLRLVLERAKQTDPPPEAERYEQREMRVLVAFCREMQRIAGDRPFFLGCRDAHKLLKVSYKTANRWLLLMERHKLLLVTKRGSPESRKANRYRYLGSLE